MTYTIPLPETKITHESRQRIGEAIYLLVYLIRSANWETGGPRPDQTDPDRTPRPILAVLTL